MQKNNKFLPAVTIIFVLLTIATIALATNSNSESLQKNALTEVDAKYVCMVTDKLFQKEQIPVVVSNKTYYGCCEMCKAKLKDNPNSRVSVDPVSGKPVDKAASVIGATSSGNIYYFENRDNFNEFVNN